MALSPADGTVSVLLVRALLGGAQAKGITLEALLTEHGATALASVGPGELADPDARVSARVALELWETLPRVTRDPNFGLWLAELSRAAPLTPASWLVLSSRTLDEGLDQAVRFQRLLHDRAAGELVRNDSGTRYVHRVGDASFRAPRHAIEFGFAQIVMLLRRATGRDVSPSELRFQHAAPEDTSIHQRVFGVMPSFGGSEDAVVFERETMALPVLTADAALGEVLASHARALLAGLPEDRTWTARVKRALAADLARAIPDLEALAQSMSMTKRTLQRRLREEGTSFEEVVDELRKSLAERYLSEQKFGVQETAFLLGYSDVSAFHRAFLRWTGVTPSRFREPH